MIKSEYLLVFLTKCCCHFCLILLDKVRVWTKIVRNSVLVYCDINLGHSYITIISVSILCNRVFYFWIQIYKVDSGKLK